MRTRTGQSFHEFKRQSNVATFPQDFANYIKADGLPYFWPAGNFHVITQYQQAKEALSNDALSADRSRFFLSRMPNMDLSLIQDFFSIVGKMMVMSDGSDHKRKRGASQVGFDDKILERFSAKVSQSVESLIQNVQDKTEFDFVSQIAQKLPSTVLADLFCIPNKDRQDFYYHSINMTAFFGGGTGYEDEDGIKVNTSAIFLRKYFKKLISERREKPQSDYVSMLLAVQKRFDLTDDEIISQAIMMLVAGQVTTTDQLCNNMFLFAQRADDQKQVKKNPHLIRNALEEYKRFDPAVTFIFRVAKVDTSIGDQEIKEGETVFISTHCANRDAVEEGHILNINRSRINHLAYGYGAHYCIGAKLGRMEMSLLFEKITQLFSTFRVKEAVRDHYSLSFSGFSKLILEVSR